MSKTVFSIVAGIAEIGVGIATLNPALIGAGVLTTAGGIYSAFQTGPKPERTTTAIKTELPVRVSGYGRAKVYGSHIE